MGAKLLLTVAASAAFLGLIMRPRPPRPFPMDGAYLRALADVHDFCAADYDMLCGGGISAVEEPEASPARRLATMFLQVEVIDAEEGDHGPGKNRAPLRLGRQEDFCLRAQYEALSEACAAAIALVDDAAPEDHHRHGVCPVLLGLAVFGVVAFLCLARKVRNKKRAVRAIFAAIRSDDVLKATVEAKAGVPVPEPCNCACGRRLSVAFLVALCLSLLVGPPTVVVSALLAAAVSGCLKACRGRATVAPPDYEAVVAEEGKAPSAPSKEAAKTDSLLAAAKKDPKTVPLLK